MEDIPVNIKQGLNIILYELFYLNSEALEALPPFGDKQEKYYKKFDQDKLKKVGRSLEWAAENNNYAFNTIYPRHKNIDNALVANFLSYTLNGIVKSGLYQKES